MPNARAEHIRVIEELIDNAFRRWSLDGGWQNTERLEALRAALVALKREAGNA